MLLIGYKFRERNQGKKQRTDTINEGKKIKGDNFVFVQSNRENNHIVIAILGKKQFSSNVYISDFGCSNNIFTDSTYDIR